MAECSNDEIAQVMRMINGDNDFMISYVEDKKKLAFRAAALKKISWLCTNYPIEAWNIETTAMVLIDVVLSLHEIPRQTYGDNDYLFVLACFSIAARHEKKDFRRTDLISVFPDYHAIIRMEKAIVRRVGGTEKTMLERGDSEIIGWNRFLGGSGGDAAKTGLASSGGDAAAIEWRGFVGGSGGDGAKTGSDGVE